MNKNKNQIKQGTVYRYYNCNPQRKLTADCVIRAICSATGETWETTLRDLTEYSIKTGYMLNCPECYGKYLKDKGFVKQKQIKDKSGKLIRFKDFCNKFDGHAVANCGKGHVTYVADGCVWDIWDTSEQTVGNYWVHKSELDCVKNMEV